MNPEVPIFLRKTYHMIDTCDESIASWGEDGTTFVVKQPETFEKVIIPQFFKHSKFTSFVRQLNFYGFRKIKFSDSILIDKDLEEKTANFWRFRHENFQRGRQDLLVEIKRSHSSSSSSSSSASVSVNVNASVSQGGSLNCSGQDAMSHTEKNAGDSNGVVPQHVLELKEELNTLKDKIKEMTSNIDELTSLVKCVTLKEEDGGHVQQSLQGNDVPVAAGGAIGIKRKYSLNNGDATVGNSSNQVPCQGGSDAVVADSVLSGQGTAMEMDVVSLTDEAFVDELFHALDDDDLEILPEPTCMSQEDKYRSGWNGATASLVRPVQIPKREEHSTVEQQGNVPDERMMNKLSDALTVLPKDVQEVLIDRLISTIHNADELKSYMESSHVVSEKKDVSSSSSTTRLSSWKTSTAVTSMESCSRQAAAAASIGMSKEQNTDVATIPLAAATLTALMTQFSAAMKDQKKAVVNTRKTIPVIPIHA